MRKNSMHELTETVKDPMHEVKEKMNRNRIKKHWGWNKQYFKKENILPTGLVFGGIGLSLSSGNPYLELAGIGAMFYGAHKLKQHKVWGSEPVSLKGTKKKANIHKGMWTEKEVARWM